MLLCRIFGHRWRVFHAEQCPVDYFSCQRCPATKHACNDVRLLPSQGKDTRCASLFEDEDISVFAVSAEYARKHPRKPLAK